MCNLLDMLYTSLTHPSLTMITLYSDRKKYQNFKGKWLGAVRHWYPMKRPIKLAVQSSGLTFPRFLCLVAINGSSAISVPKIRSMPADTTDELQGQLNKM